MSLPTDRLATVQEVAHYLNLTPTALYMQRYRGDPPGSLGIMVGRKLAYRSEDIERWLQEQSEQQ